MSFLKIFAKQRNRGKEIEPEDIFLDSRNLSSLNTDIAEGVFTKPVAKGSFTVVTASIFLMFSIFVYKAYTIQITNYDFWKDKALNNYLDKTYIFANRGLIKDRNGEVLAWNESVKNKEDAINYIPKRHYIDKEGFSNLLGFVSYPKKDNKGIFWQDDYIGIDGLEKYYNEYLSGIKGDRILEVNVKGEIIRDNVLNNPVDGKVLELNIDSTVQDIFYKRLKDVVDSQGFSGGSGILFDLKDGGVITAVSYPDYNNNIFVNADTAEEKDIKNKYLKDKNTPMLNRALAGSYVPGSIVKPFMAYAALNENVIDQYKNIYSSGRLVIKNKYGGPDTVFRDWKAHGYVDARKALAVSSDEYFYQVGGGFMDQAGLGIKRIDDYMIKFGFASTTGVDFLAEKSGIIPTPEWKKKNFIEGDWLLGNTYHASIGQYGFKVSPISIARSVAMIATDGRIITPRIKKSETLETEKENLKIDLDLNNLKVVKEGMLAAASEGGTAHYFNNLPFKVAAKTGTAELGVKNERVNSWTTGYYPYENPRYVFVFMMENGPHTNTVGASKVMREVFQDMIDLKLEYVNFDKI